MELYPPLLPWTKFNIHLAAILAYDGVASRQQLTFATNTSACSAIAFSCSTVS
jgi:hypothetical protein